MPSVSRAQRRLIGLAEHHPEKVNAENRSILSMSHADMHDYASTKEKGLPEHVRKNPLAFRRYRDGGVARYDCGGIVVPLKIK